MEGNDMNGIDMLLALQEFREAGGALLLDFLQKMSYIGEISTVRVLLAVIYWCMWKELGTYLLIGWSGVRLANGLLKVTVCEYRPWIQDTRITPEPKALSTATGYTFPSGHSMNAACVFGGTMLYKGVSWFLRIICALTFASICFSRPYLGVHYVNDVVVGGLTGLVVMFLTSLLMRWVDRHPDRDWLVVVCILVISVIIAVYAALKSYPVDLDAEGNVLVDGAKMAKDTFKGCGWAAGILIGWLLERRYVNFTTDVDGVTRITRAIVGLFFYYVLTLVALTPLTGLLPAPFDTIVSSFLSMFYIVWFFPWLTTKYEKSPAAEVTGQAARHIRQA
jgi:membrane-associated phospholipid phosphatase